MSFENVVMYSSVLPPSDSGEEEKGKKKGKKKGKEKGDKGVFNMDDPNAGEDVEELLKRLK